MEGEWEGVIFCLPSRIARESLTVARRAWLHWKTHNEHLSKKSKNLKVISQVKAWPKVKIVPCALSGTETALRTQFLPKCFFRNEEGTIKVKVLYQVEIKIHVRSGQPK